MGSRHMDSSPTVLSTIQPTTSYAAGGAGEPPDLASLLAVAERMLGTWDGVGDRFQREVGLLTQQRAVLRLHPAERARIVRSELPADARLHRVEFAGQVYETLAIMPDAHEPSMPAQLDANAQQLARVCGALLCLLEQAALLRVLSQHLAPELLQPLTQRQREVLELIARGLSDDEIVEALHISPGTLRRHRYDMYARLGIHDAHDALLAAYQYGLLSYITPGA